MRSEKPPFGVWPVLLTPFKGDRTIDWATLDLLTDWHIEAGAAGIFADAQSAEVFQLTNGDKLAIAAAVVKRARGRVPVFAGAFTRGSLDEQIEFVRRMADTGVGGVVVTVCQLVARNRSDTEWKGCAERLLAQTDGIPLGLYEMPVPYHRVLTPELISWAGSTRRFFFHKDTTSKRAAIRLKINAIQDTVLGFYNANTPTLLDSLQAGGHGYSGIGANYIPELYVELCRAAKHHLASAAPLQEFLAGFDSVMHHRYPAAAKVFLAMRGLHIHPVCRAMDEDFSEDDLASLRSLLDSARNMAEELRVRMTPGWS